jgi:hypothetical protein
MVECVRDRDEQRRAKQSILLELNERVHEAAKDFGSAEDERDLWDFTCECGARDCRVSVSLTLAEYEALREAGEPVLAAGHEVQRAAKVRAELEQKTAERNTPRT